MELYWYMRVSHETFNMLYVNVSNDMVINTILLSAVEN